MKQQSTIALAVGSALAAFGGTANALLPASFSNPTSSLYISGATALDETIRASVARLCIPGSLDEYRWGSNQRVFSCSIVASLFPGLSTSQVAIYKTSEGGSGLGVTPLVNQTAVPFLNINSITLALCAGSTVVSAGVVSGVTLVPAYTLRTCATSTDLRYQTILSDAGISDVEPKMFTDADVSALTPKTPSGLVFGIAVTRAAYDSLQVVQGKSGTCLSTATATLGTLTSITSLTSIRQRDLEECMPSLSKETIGGLMAGQVSWDSIQGPGGALTPPVAQPEVYVVRRFPSSGTQKSTELFLYGGISPTDLSHSVKCNPSAIPMNAGSLVNNATDEATFCGFGPSVAPTATTAEGSGSGNVRNCLNLHNTNGRFAIGLISLESSYASGNGWRFIKIDGQAPSLLNAWKTTYKNFTETSIQKAPYLTPGSDADIIADAMFGVNGLGATDVQRALNSTFRHPWGDGATLALAFSGATPLTITGTPKTQLDIQTQPVWHYSKSAVGGTDNCRPAFQIAPVETP